MDYIEAARAAAAHPALGGSCVPGLEAWAAAREPACAALEALATAAAASARPQPPPALAAALAAAHPALSPASSDSLGCALRWAAALLGGGLPSGLRWRVASCHPLDVAALHGFVTELAAFEEGLDQVATSPATFMRDGFGPAQQFHALLLEVPAAQWQARGGGGGGSGGGAPAEAAAGAAPPQPPPPPTALPGHVALGMALLHSSYSTWQGRTLYLEDLYLQPCARGQGAAGRVFELLAAAALAASAQRMQWCCLTWNQRAMDVYAGLKAEKLEEWRLWRLGRLGLEEVASGRAPGAGGAAAGEQ